MGYTNADTLARATVRRIAFPNDRCLGRLYVREDFVHERFLASAQGIVSVDAAKPLRLKIDAQACADLSPLRDLAADDISVLWFEGATILPAQFAHIAHLRGLRELHFAHCEVQSN